MNRIVILLLLLLNITVFSQNKSITVKDAVVTRNFIYQGDTVKSFGLPDSIYRLQFVTDSVAPPHSEGQIFYDTLNKSFSACNDVADVSLQIGQENWIRSYNNSGLDIPNGKIVYIDSSVVGLPSIELAQANDPTDCDRVIGMTTHTIGSGEIGYVTTFGVVRDINTSTFKAGDQLYLSHLTAGDVTDVQPIYPNYIIKIGSVITSAANGSIFVNVIGQPEDIQQNLTNGSFLESFAFTISSNGSVITGALNNPSGDFLTMNLSDGFTKLDVSPQLEIPLTGGTATAPQFGYVYIPIGTKLLDFSTSFWPSEEHIPIAKVALLDATRTQQDGALRNQNVNDHLAGMNGQGHISHMGRRMRKMNAAWESGGDLSVNIETAPSPDNVWISTTEAKVWQLHLQDFAAQNTQAGDDIHIVNDNTAPYKTVSNLNGELTDATGASLAGKSFSYVIWGVANKSGEPSHLMLNLPSGSYSSAGDAINDADNYTVYNIPSDFNGVGFLIARLTFSQSAAGGGSWTLQENKSLLGFVPNNAAGGGGGGGGGATSYLGLSDTPASYSGQNGKISTVGSSELGLEFQDFYTVKNHCFGEMNMDGGSVSTLASTNVKITSGYQPGDIQNALTSPASGYIQVQQSGTFKITYFFSGTHTAGATITFIPYVGGIALTRGRSIARFDSTTGTSMSMIQTLSANDQISVYVFSDMNGTLDLTYGSLLVERIN